MVSPDHPLPQLLAVIDMVWAEPEPGPPGRGAPKWYSEKAMFKVYVVSLLKTLWARRSLWRFLKANPTVAAACGWPRIPDQRTLDRRLVDMAPQAEAQIRALGLVLSVEHVTNSATAASDGSAFETPGPVWHKKDKEAGVVPEGLHGLDPLPAQGKVKASAFILLALYAWNLIVLFNFLNDRPLGEVKPVLDCL
jgi:hypothetical protein